LDFHFSIPQIIAFCSQGTTLQASSVIWTGSSAVEGFAMKPAKYLIPGDIVEITVKNVNTLVHRQYG